jgi:hypothetical protein
MSTALQITLLFAAAFACMAILFRAQWLTVPVTAIEADPQERPKQPEDSGEEQLPETDRAPRRFSHVLTYTVALTAAVRLGVLVAFHR